MFLTQQKADLFVGGSVEIRFNVTKSVNTIALSHEYKGVIKAVHSGDDSIKVAFSELYKVCGSGLISMPLKDYFINSINYAYIEIDYIGVCRARFTSEALHESLAIQSAVVSPEIIVQNEKSLIPLAHAQ